MTSRSPSRGRLRTRSPYSEGPATKGGDRSVSPRRSISPRSPSRSPRRNGRYKSESRSRSRSRSVSRGRSPSPVRSTKIVVEKLTKNVNEDHLREIFSTYGSIRDLDLPMNRSFGTNRGTAYILFTNESDAEAAIAHMHEAQIDGAIINVSIVLPRRKFSPSPPTARRGANIDPRIPMNAPANFRPGPPARRRSPPGNYGRGDRGFDTYRPRSVSRSRSPRRHRTRSRSLSSRSRSPPRRRGGGGGGRRDSPARNGGRRRRSPSYSSYSSYDERDKSRSRSRNRGGRRR